MKADMSEYEGFTDTEHVFVDSNMQEIKTMMDDGESFVVYFGFSTCPWCIEALPILNETAKEFDSAVYYIDTRKDSLWTSNLDIDDYDLVVECFGDYMQYDDNGVKHLYTPSVVFVKNGEVVLFHQGTVDGHNAHERTMEESEAEELRELYRSGFSSLK